MTHDQLLIKLSATTQALACTQNCLAQSYRFPLKDVEKWWTEARAKVREIEKLEQEIADSVPTTSKT